MQLAQAGLIPEILLVEDNEDDMLLAPYQVNLHHVENGRECLSFLRKEADYLDAPTPDLILMDLNMPVMNGQDTLAEIVKDEELQQVPVIILTTAAGDSEVLVNWKLRCSSFLIKPVEFPQFQTLINQFCEYWFGTNHLPPRSVS